ncbi:MAG: hypothetical protein IKI03_00140 [Clostridia bacterium]|nr:hypothetical protein [Clostridia bacterium]
MRGEKMGFGLIIAGLLFLVNPCYNVIDVLPDFIGFFLIFRGLSRMAPLDPSLEDSRSLFSRLSLIDVSKYLVFFILVMGRGGNTVGPDGLPLDALSVRATNETILLLITFVFAVVELIFFVPAVNKLFNGVDGVSRRLSTGFPEKAFETRALIITFFTVRCAASVISELPALFISSHYGDVTVGGIGPENLRPYLYVMNSVVTVALGAVFLYRSIRFFGGLKNNEKLISAMTEATERFSAENPDVRLGVRMRNASVLFMVSTVLSVWVTSGGMTLIPGAFCAVFIIMTSIVLRDFFTAKRGFLAVVIPAALYGAVSTVSFILESRFFSDYTRFEVFRIKGAGRLFPPMVVTEEIGFLLLAFSMIALSAAFYKAVRSHVSKAGSDIFVTEKVTFTVDKYRSELDASLKKRIRFARIAGFVHFAFLIALPAVEPFIPSVFPEYLDGARTVDLPGHVMSFVTAAYFAVAVLWIVFNLILCLFSNAEMYRPMAKRERI